MGQSVTLFLQKLRNKNFSLAIFIYVFLDLRHMIINLLNNQPIVDFSFMLDGVLFVNVVLAHAVLFLISFILAVGFNAISDFLDKEFGVSEPPLPPKP
jgi:hypothetical protein